MTSGELYDILPLRGEMDCFAALAMTGVTPPHSRGAVLPEVCIVMSLNKRGRRESRVPNAPAASRAKVKSTRVSHYRFTGNIPAFPAQWFTAYSALSPVNGLFCHRRLRFLSQT
jgi:hypothetical protein